MTVPRRPTPPLADFEASMALHEDMARRLGMDSTARTSLDLATRPEGFDRIGVYLPPLMEALRLCELEHNARNNRIRAR